MINEFLAALILAVVQGVTEWFPVSSSSHLVIISALIGFENSLKFDVALHFGTLMAVFVYFGKDIVDIIRDLLSLKFNTPHGKLGIMLIIATIPAIFTGFLFRGMIEGTFGNLGLISLGLGVTGLFLLIASRDYKWKNKGKLGYGAALVIGVAQSFAVFRGISRTGSTVGSGLLLGLDEKTAVKFSFLLSIPIVFGANIVSIGNDTIPKEFILASLVSFLVGVFVINISYKYVLSNRKNLRWFGLYVLLLAIALGIWVLR